MVKELTNSNWCENVDGAKELSVVFFYANWCRNCKAVMPVFKRLELGLGLGLGLAHPRVNPSSP